MPIRPENRDRYPKDWKRIRARILERAHNRCEFCGVENHTMRLNPKTGKEAKIILTIAHLNHEPEDCRPENLRALCQRCTTSMTPSTEPRQERNALTPKKKKDEKI